MTKLSLAPPDHCGGSRNCRSPYLLGFTLIELLVVVAIIVILIAILIPSLGKAKARSQLVACKANIHSILQAHGMYRTEWEDNKPPLYRKRTLSTQYDWVSPDIRWSGFPVGQGLLVDRGYTAINVLFDPSAEMKDDAARDLANWNAAGAVSGGCSYAYYWREALAVGALLSDAPRGVTYSKAVDDGKRALLMDINAEQGHSYLGEYAGRPWVSHAVTGRVNVGYIDGAVLDFPQADVLLQYPGLAAEELAWFGQAHQRFGSGN